MTNDYSTKPRSPLARGLSALRYVSPFQLLNWRRHGFVVLRNFFGEEQIAAANRELDSLWNERIRVDNPLVIDVYGDPPERKLFRNATDEDRTCVYKLDDVYLESDLTKSLALDDRLTTILKALIDGPPMICNSLHFERGSEQPLHFDSYYMPPPPGSRLIVSSICLEDVHPDAGPVSYVPGSHKIEPFIGKSGSRAIDDATEFDDASRHASERLNLEKDKKVFLGKRGDVLIWHEQLYHGGSSNTDRDRTRRSLVTHYYNCPESMKPSMKALGDGYWLAKTHPPVP